MGRMNVKALINFISYIAIIFVSILLIIKAFIKGNPQVCKVLTNISEVIAFVMLFVNALFYAKSKRSTVCIVVLAISVVLIIVSYVV